MDCIEEFSECPTTRGNTLAIRGCRREEAAGRRHAIAGRDSRVIAIRPHALTQKVNVGGLRIEARQCKVVGTVEPIPYTADSAINQSVSAPNRRPAALIKDEEIDGELRFVEISRDEV
ncbi:hypothetical protein K0M31_016820 [Melipona bicolor]|uniref:Uncharacterized protein n=1 Tax=Melipona bicolor TaxID=60889 RepID=A0AA40FE26_9HYME|nr:hypothetical protein K0M31_016820 [Melipona bicolor]